MKIHIRTQILGYETYCGIPRDIDTAPTIVNLLLSVQVTEQIKHRFCKKCLIRAQEL